MDHFRHDARFSGLAGSDPAGRAAERCPPSRFEGVATAQLSEVAVFVARSTVGLTPAVMPGLPGQPHSVVREPDPASPWSLGPGAFPWLRCLSEGSEAWRPAARSPWDVVLSAALDESQRVKFKKLARGGYFRIINCLVSVALEVAACSEYLVLSNRTAQVLIQIRVACASRRRVRHRVQDASALP